MTRVAAAQTPRSHRIRGSAARVMLIAVVLATSACADGTVDPPAPEISPAALSYLTEALDTMQRHSVNRYRIDWPSFRADVLRRAGAAQTYSDTYNAIRYAVLGLGDNHSTFHEPDSAASAAAARSTDPVWQPGGAPGSSPPSSPPRADRVRGRLGYLRVPGFRGSGPDSDEFAQTLQDMVRAIDTAAPTCGWIIDLRANTGGNVSPMLAGVGPVLGEGLAAYYVDPDSVWTFWYYRDGEVGINFRPSGWRLPAPYVLAEPDPPVAVLTGNSTISSGEAIATMFSGRPETRSFGVRTGGLSTARGSYRLRDGAVLALAAAVFADRTRRIFPSGLPPDEQVSGGMQQDPNDGDVVVNTAADWLLTRPRCR